MGAHSRANVRWTEVIHFPDDDKPRGFIPPLKKISSFAFPGKGLAFIQNSLLLSWKCQRKGRILFQWINASIDPYSKAGAVDLSKKRGPLQERLVGGGFWWGMRHRRWVRGPPPASPVTAAWQRQRRHPPLLLPRSDLLSPVPWSPETLLSLAATTWVTSLPHPRALPFRVKKKFRAVEWWYG